jgi:hypothetical protein
VAQVAPSLPAVGAVARPSHTVRLVSTAAPAGPTSVIKTGNFGQGSCTAHCLNPQGGSYAGATAAYDTWQKQ